MSIYIAGSTPALNFARQHLAEIGISVTNSPRWDTKHLLLDVPSFRPGSNLNIDTVLSSLPREITVWGGNLNHSSLEGYRCMDLLKDEPYLWKNAAITADCTLKVAGPMLKKPWNEINALIIGRGRIGKQLAPKLEEQGCRVTVATRNSRIWAAPDGVAVNMDQMRKKLPEFDMIINTAPAEVITADDLANCRSCLKIDLASKKGIAGEDVVWARGLPGIYAPERSGRLIAETFLRILKEETP